MDFPHGPVPGSRPRQLAGGPGEGPGRSGGLEGKQGASAARLGGGPMGKLGELRMEDGMEMDQIGTS